MRQCQRGVFGRRRWEPIRNRLGAVELVAHHQEAQEWRYITSHKFTSFLMTPEAEKFNGWAAMLGFVAAFGAYATTGQIIPGIF